MQLHGNVVFFLVNKPWVVDLNILVDYNGGGL
jgi:hypothetical protein